MMGMRVDNREIVTTSGATVIGVSWYTSGMMTLGIVIVQTKVGALKSYIGHAPGNSENDDIKYIAEWGAKFPLIAAKKLIDIDDMYEEEDH